MASQTYRKHANFRVLIVEDEYLVAEEIADTLRESKIHVVGPIGMIHEAYEAVQDALLDCAVMDINIGGGASFPLIDVLIQRNVPVLLMTGYDQEELPVKYRSLPLLQKPLLRGELAKALGSLFEF